MLTKITGETPFQVLTNSFSISPSNEGYTLQISADGVNYSNLFTVAAGTTRLVTGVAANSYYRLLGNQSAIVVNWARSCAPDSITALAFADVEYVPADKTIYFKNTVNEVLGTIDTTDFVIDGMVENVTLSGSILTITFNTAAGKQDIVIDLNEFFNPAHYWTSAQTQSAITEAYNSGITYVACYQRLR